MKKSKTIPDRVPRPRRGYFPKELHPCPFCGKNPHVIVEKAPTMHSDFVGVTVHIQCNNHQKCVVCPRFGMRRGTNVPAKSPLRHLDVDFLRHRFENQLWRKMRTIWNKRSHSTHVTRNQIQKPKGR